MDCGQFRTQTPGGWGSPANGNNPGAYRDAHFADAFPNGISIGCDLTLQLTTAAAVQSFLPSGGSPATLIENLVDPADYKNVLAGHLVTLSLSVGFDEYDPNFSPSNSLMENQIVSQGTFEGWTVAEILNEANTLLGGCPSDFSPSEMVDVLTAINENYDDGAQNNGFLECPEQILSCELQLIGVSTHCNQNDTYTLTVALAGSNGSFQINSESALAGSGAIFCFGNPAGSTAVLEMEIDLVFTQGSNYSFSISATEDAGCTNAPDIAACMIEETTGVSPECCELTISCPELTKYNFDCFSEVPAADTEMITYSNACGEVTVTVDEQALGSGCASNPLRIIRTYSVTDGTNMETCSQTFQVVDNISPVISCPPDQHIFCSAQPIVPEIYATATDNCDQSVYISYSDEPMLNCGQFNRTWMAMDDCGNTAFCSQVVYVTDTLAPQIFAPSTLLVACGTSLDPSAIGTPSVSDYCSSVTLSHSDGEISGTDCNRQFLRIWIATDQCGNTSTFEQYVMIRDLKGPVISGVPPSTYLQCGEAPPPAEAIAVDACSGDTVPVHLEETINMNGCRQVIQRTYSATDNCGNTSHLNRSITIQDTQGPQIICPSNAYLACGDQDTDPEVLGSASAIDNCSGDRVIISYTDSDLNIYTCPPRITRTWTAADTCGNTSNCTQFIYFEDSAAPELFCLADTTVNCDSGGITPEYTGTPLATDGCSALSLDYSDGSLDGNCPASFIRTWTATDACGQVTSCFQRITVIDNQPPVISCPSDIAISCAYSNTGPTITGFATAVDGCLNVNVTYTDEPEFGDCEKYFVRKWTASDNCGNTSTCEQKITIEDHMLPYISCPGDTTLSCQSDISPENIGEAFAVDFCSDVSLSFSDVELSGACPATVQRTWTATDACGNSKSCTQNIYFESEGAPSIFCPGDVTIDCSDSTDPSNTGTATTDGGCSSVEVTFSDSLAHTETSTTESCGQLRTQTQGGWGATASGNNPAIYRDHHFQEAFPNGLVVGCNFTLTLTSAMAVQAFLPSGGPVKVLSENLVDPQGFTSVLAGQLVAATLSVGFDNADPSFGYAENALGEMLIASGTFSGKSVNEVIQLANVFFGGCASEYSGSDFVSVLTGINENFDDGNQDHGFLDCPKTTGEGNPNCGSIYRTWTATDGCGLSSTCTQVIVLNPDAEIGGSNTSSGLTAYPSPTSGDTYISLNGGFENGDRIDLCNVSGQVINTYSLKGDAGNFKINLVGLGPGIYLVHWIGSTENKVCKIYKN